MRIRIREMTYMGLRVWPPQGLGSSRVINQKAIFKDVKTIVGTDLLRIDVEHNGIPHLGLMPVEKELRHCVYLKLKENVGRELADIADLEIDREEDEAPAARIPATGRINLTGGLQE